MTTKTEATELDRLRAENARLREALEDCSVYANASEVLEENERLRDALRNIVLTIANRDTMDGSITAVHKAFEAARTALYGHGKPLVLEGYSCAGVSGKIVSE